MKTLKELQKNLQKYINHREKMFEKFKNYIMGERKDLPRKVTEI